MQLKYGFLETLQETQSTCIYKQSPFFLFSFYRSMRLRTHTLVLSSAMPHRAVFLRNLHLSLMPLPCNSLRRTKAEVHWRPENWFSPEKLSAKFLREEAEMKWETLINFPAEQSIKPSLACSASHCGGKSHNYIVKNSSCPGWHDLFGKWQVIGTQLGWWN